MPSLDPCGLGTQLKSSHNGKSLNYKDKIASRPLREGREKLAIITKLGCLASGGGLRPPVCQCSKKGSQTPFWSRPRKVKST